MRNNRLTEDIKSSLDIAEIIGQYTSLRRTSRGYSGLCPFHDEKTPSFYVYTDSQTYYCFSCHEAGDIFTFVMKKNGLSFLEAIEFLASQAGIDTSKYSGQSAKKTQRKRSLYDVMAMAGEYFRDCFKRLPGGKAYFTRRGFTENYAETYGIGYAPDSWDGLIQALKKKGVSEREMIDAGLVIQNERGGYDRFRGRLIFTVKNLAGKIIAFGGRAIADSPAKYINSPESEIYKKRSNLYLIEKASSKIREKGYSILCEGYLDALRLHVCGFTETVASLGTSLTAEQAGLLKRFADRCYICYDTDAAGQAASIRGMYILSENGLDVRVVRLPEGKDPDEFLSSNEPAMFQKALDEARSLIEYHIETLSTSLSDPLKRKQAVRELWEGVKRLQPHEALRYVASLGSAFELPIDEVRKIILRNKNDPSGPAGHFPLAGGLIDNGLECALCALLFSSRECRMKFKPEELNELLTDEETRMTAEALIDNDPYELMNLWRSIGDTAGSSIIAKGEIFLTNVSGSNSLEKWESVHSGLEALRIRRRIREIEPKFLTNTATLEESGEFMELRRKLQALQI